MVTGHAFVFFGKFPSNSSSRCSIEIGYSKRTDNVEQSRQSSQELSSKLRAQRKELERPEFGEMIDRFSCRNSTTLLPNESLCTLL